jgi:hypothetical protein
MVGTLARPSLRAASSRPWPAITPRSPSTRIGLVKPNSRIEAAICATCASEWVRAFRAYGISSSTRALL